MSNGFFDLTPLDNGMRLSEGKIIDRLNILTDVAKSLWSGENMMDGVGMNVSRGSNGVSLRTKRKRKRGGGSGVAYPLELLTSRPPYVPVPTNPPTPSDPPTTKDFWIRYGTIQHVEATNFNEDFTLDLTSIGNVYVYAKVVLSQGDQLEVTSWTIEQDTTSPETAEGWSATKIRPTTLNLMLGYWLKPAEAGGSWTMITQHGDIQLDEYIVHIAAGSNNYTRRIASRRLP